MRSFLPLRAPAIVLLGLLWACAPARQSAGDGPDRNTLEEAELAGTVHANAYALIRALRPHWLELRGSAAIDRRMEKRVYLDDMYLGGVSFLRQVTTPSIERIDYLDGPAATQRFGSDHAAGVIQIHSRNR